MSLLAPFLSLPLDDSERVCTAIAGLMRTFSGSSSFLLPAAVIDRLFQIWDDDGVDTTAKVLACELLWCVGDTVRGVWSGIAERARKDMRAAGAPDLALAALSSLSRLPTDAVLPLLSSPGTEQALCALLLPDQNRSLRCAALALCGRLAFDAWLLADAFTVTTAPPTSYPDLLRRRQSVHDTVIELVKGIIRCAEDDSDVVCGTAQQALLGVFQRFDAGKPAQLHTPVPLSVLACGSEQGHVFLHTVSRRLCARLGFLAHRAGRLPARTHAVALHLIAALLDYLMHDASGAGGIVDPPLTVHLDHQSSANDPSVPSLVVQAVSDWFAPDLTHPSPVVRHAAVAGTTRLLSCPPSSCAHVPASPASLPGLTPAITPTTAPVTASLSPLAVGPVASTAVLPPRTPQPFVMPLCVQALADTDVVCVALKAALDLCDEGEGTHVYFPPLQQLIAQLSVLVHVEAPDSLPAYTARQGLAGLTPAYGSRANSRAGDHNAGGGGGGGGGSVFDSQVGTPLSLPVHGAAGLASRSGIVVQSMGSFASSPGVGRITFPRTHSSASDATGATAGTSARAHAGAAGAAAAAAQGTAAEGYGSTRTGLGPSSLGAGIGGGVSGGLPRTHSATSVTAGGSAAQRFELNGWPSAAHRKLGRGSYSFAPTSRFDGLSAGAGAGAVASDGAGPVLGDATGAVLYSGAAGNASVASMGSAMFASTAGTSVRGFQSMAAVVSVRQLSSGVAQSPLPYGSSSSPTRALRLGMHSAASARGSGGSGGGASLGAALGASPLSSPSSPSPFFPPSASFSSSEYTPVCAPSRSLHGLDVGEPDVTCVSGSSDPLVVTLRHAVCPARRRVALYVHVTNCTRMRVPQLTLSLSLQGPLSFLHSQSVAPGAEGAPRAAGMYSCTHALPNGLPAGATVLWVPELHVTALGTGTVVVSACMDARDSSGGSSGDGGNGDGDGDEEGEGEDGEGGGEGGGDAGGASGELRGGSSAVVDDDAVEEWGTDGASLPFVDPVYVTVRCCAYVVPLSSFLVPVALPSGALGLAEFAAVWDRLGHSCSIDAASSPIPVSSAPWSLSHLRPVGLSAVPWPHAPSSYSCCAFVGQDWGGRTVYVVVSGERAPVSAPAAECVSGFPVGAASGADALARTDAGVAASGVVPSVFTLPPRSFNAATGAPTDATAKPVAGAGAGASTVPGAGIAAGPTTTAAQVDDEVDLLGLFDVFAPTPVTPTRKHSTAGASLFPFQTPVRSGAASDLLADLHMQASSHFASSSSSSNSNRNSLEQWCVRVEVRCESSVSLGAIVAGCGPWVYELSSGQLRALRTCTPVDASRVCCWWEGHDADSGVAGVLAMCGVGVGAAPAPAAVNPVPGTLVTETPPAAVQAESAPHSHGLHALFGFS